MVAAHTMHADIYQVQLCNRMKRCRTIKTSASMAADVRHTYFFVSVCEIRYLPEIFDTTGWRHDLVDGTDLDDISDFDKITCNHMLFKSEKKFEKIGKIEMKIPIEGKRGNKKFFFLRGKKNYLLGYQALFNESLFNIIINYRILRQP